ncbi:MAG: bifunctional diaminohydroxyphosphoribosylaminopyrimidine deaminase/5-amino-6-(5-phosphoribosylamino)uracil reductase RibD [Acidobacteria bacterium]|nr:bifunctional diaminohydroxyphosphoribosylaminopyrimidine deaminase/5-amino-6-(5-phosphoribosylamino)uracil reductase RibD [Acidobacteriota bacterium]
MTLDHSALMVAAMAEGEKARLHAPPNPWVGALVARDGVVVGAGHTQVPGESHAEVDALRHAGERARGATMVVTLEPCCHVGRTGPCVDAIIDAGIERVVVGTLDPDPRVAGGGVAALRDAGLAVDVGVELEAVRAQLAPYLWHRVTGRPYVVLKIAATLDGMVAMGDGSSQWITGEAARRDAHVVRAQSQAVLVGAQTVRADDPQLTARLDGVTLEPLRVVLGHAPAGARVHPCWERSGDLGAVLNELGAHDILQVLVEGGATVASEFLDAGLVNHVVWYVAPAWAGSASGRGALAGLSTPSMDALRRARFSDVRRLEEDVRMDLEV